MTTIADLIDISYSDNAVVDGTVSGAAFWNSGVLEALKDSINMSNSVIEDEVGTDTTAGTLRYRVTTNEADIATLEAYVDQDVSVDAGPSFVRVMLTGGDQSNMTAAASQQYVVNVATGSIGKATQAEVSAATEDGKYVTSYAAAVLAQLAGADFTGSVTIAAGESLSVDTISEKTAAAGVTIDSVVLKDNAIAGLLSLGVDNLLLDGNTLSSTTGDINITPLAGEDVVIDSHWQFDGNDLTALTDNNTLINAYAGKAVVIDGHLSFDGAALTALTDNDTVLSAYAGKNITIEDVTFDGGVVGAVTQINDVLAAELSQLETIGSTTISAAQWGYLGELDQALKQADSPTFNALTVTSLTDGTATLTGGALSGATIDGGDAT